jgi:hypothetical protein
LYYSLVGLGPLVDPGIYGYVPELGVLWLHDPVAFVGEVEHFAGNFEALQCGEELRAFGNIQAVVKLAVNDQRGRLEVFGVECGRPLAIWIFTAGFAVIIPRLAFEFPLVEP